MPDSSEHRFFYGYIIVIAGFIIMSVMWSVHFTFGVFFKELSAEFSLSRAITSGAWSTSNLIYGFASMLVGRLTDKLGPRIIVTFCGILFGLGYLLISQINAVWQLYLLLGVMGGLGMGAAFVPVVTTIARWFVKHRGVTTGMVSAGVSIGGLVGPIVASWLISDYGWRSAYIVLGASVLVVNILMGQFLRSDPGKMGQRAYGENNIGSGELNWQAEGLPFSTVSRLRQFWLPLGAWFCFGAFGMSIVVHIVPHVTDIGISATTAASILATLGGIGIGSRIIMGIVSDKIGSRMAVIISLGLQLAALISLLFAEEVWMFYLLVLAFGFGFGGCGALVSLLLADLFGRKAHGLILGFFVAAFGFGSSVGPILIGYVFDVTGSYQVGFLLCVVLSIIALTIIMLLKPASVQILWSRR